MKNTIFKFVLITAVFLFMGYQMLLIDLPDVSFLKSQNPQYSSFMNTDNILNGNNHSNSVVYVSILKVSPHLIRAVLASEDDLYFTHNGYNWKEFSKAIEVNFKRKKLVRGGSTITQQLARNLFLSKDKSIIRKLREWILTSQLESELSKERILELYLNFAEFGPGIYGVHAASKYHFRTKPKYLTRHQSALLAAMLPNPKYYGKKPYPAKTYHRQRKILYRMARFDLHIPGSLFSDDFKEFDD